LTALRAALVLCLSGIAACGSAAASKEGPPSRSHPSGSGSDAGSTTGGEPAGTPAPVGSDSDSGTEVQPGPPDSASDAASCASTPESTSGQPGYLGDWMPGDYPSDFVSNGSYLTISGVAGQMNNDRQYAVHVPTGYRSDTPVPALFCIHGLGQTAALFCLDT